MKIVAKKDRKLLLINTGNTQNENKAETIELIVPEEYEDYNKKIVFITPDGAVWDVITDNKYKLTNAITKYEKVNFYIWLTKEVDGESIDFRTKTKTLSFYHNVDASDEITDEKIHGVNTVVNILEEEITKVDSLETELRALITDIQNKLDNGEFDGEDGRDGRDGKDAKINGKNAIEIEAGENITIDDTENGIKINSDVPIKDNYTITNNSNNKLQTVGIVDQNAGNIIKYWKGTQAEYDAITTKDNDTVYYITDAEDVYITKSVDDLLNYYKKNEIFTKQEVNDLINAITTMDLRIVESLPVEDISTTTIYLVPKSEAETNNAYDEYIYVSNSWEFIGSTEVDLADYVKNTDYATSSKGGVVKSQPFYGTYCGPDGFIQATQKNYSEYLSSHNASFIGKGTLENVIAGKGLNQIVTLTQTEYDALTTKDNNTYYYIVEE